MICPHCLTSNENKNHCVEWIRYHRGLMAIPLVNTELKAYGAERKIRCSASECVKITVIKRWVFKTLPVNEGLKRFKTLHV